jgi:hypothetical protein
MVFPWYFHGISMVFPMKNTHFAGAIPMGKSPGGPWGVPGNPRHRGVHRRWPAPLRSRPETWKGQWITVLCTYYVYIYSIYIYILYIWWYILYIWWWWFFFLLLLIILLLYIYCICVYIYYIVYVYIYIHDLKLVLNQFNTCIWHVFSMILDGWLVEYDWTTTDLFGLSFSQYQLSGQLSFRKERTNLMMNGWSTCPWLAGTNPGCWHMNTVKAWTFNIFHMISYCIYNII